MKRAVRRIGVLLGLALPCLAATAAWSQRLELASQTGTSIRIDALSQSAFHPPLLGASGGALEGSLGSASSDAAGFSGMALDDVGNFNLGVDISPLRGFILRADAWRKETVEVPDAAVSGGVSRAGSGLVSGDTLSIAEYDISYFSVSNPLLITNVSSSGIGIGASYEWDTASFGYFTLSSSTSYLDEFRSVAGITEIRTDNIGTRDERFAGTELQSNLTLNWRLGNHTAGAIINYIDSYQDAADLDVEKFNALVDNLTTVDLQYGYQVNAGDNDRAIISFGIKNVFDENTARLLNADSRVLDQNGRVAYGSIKYQF